MKGTNIDMANNKLDLINSEINSFNICPLCGNPLNCDNHVSE